MNRGNGLKEVRSMGLAGVLAKEVRWDCLAEVEEEGKNGDSK